MCVSKTFTKAKNLYYAQNTWMSIGGYWVWAQSAIYPNWKTYLSQFIDKFLKIEEVEYLIHYVKFNMWPPLFYVNFLCFPIIF